MTFSLASKLLRPRNGPLRSVTHLPTSGVPYDILAGDVLTNSTLRLMDYSYPNQHKLLTRVHHIGPIDAILRRHRGFRGLEHLTATPMPAILSLLVELIQVMKGHNQSD